MSSVEIASEDVFRYALRLGDDSLVLAQRLAEWCSHAPEIEQDIALTNIALDLLGQARSLLAYAGELEDSGRNEDDLAYGRDERQYRNVLLVEQPNGDFACTIARQLLFSAYQFELYGALQHSMDDTIAGVAAKAVKEVAYHRDYASEWTLRLGDGTAESHSRMQRAVDRVWPYAAEMFESDDLTLRLATGRVGVDPGQLAGAWARKLDEILIEATIERPEGEWRPSGGRDGRHTEALGYILAEMQHLHRSNPGVAW